MANQDINIGMIVPVDLKSVFYERVLPLFEVFAAPVSLFRLVIWISRYFIGDRYLRGFLRG